MNKWFYDHIFVILSETWAKQMVNISKRYVKQFLIYNWFSEIFSAASASLHTLWSLTLSDPGGVLFVQPLRINWLPIFYECEFQIQYLMVFQVEVVYIAY